MVVPSIVCLLSGVSWMEMVGGELGEWPGWRRLASVRGCPEGRQRVETVLTVTVVMSPQYRDDRGRVRPGSALMMAPSTTPHI